MSGQRFGKLGIEIDRIVGLAVSVSPTAPIRRTLHPALDGMVVHHLYALKCRCSSYPPGQIDLYAGLLAFRESETKHSAMRQSGRFRLNLIIGKKNRVIACRGFFGRLVIRERYPSSGLSSVPANVCKSPIVGITKKFPKSPYQPIPDICVNANPSMVVCS